jgi:integrase/recombinase XerD
MSDLVTLGPWLRRFMCEYIVTERNLARNTCKSYRDTFSLLLPFVSRKLRKPVDRLAARDLTSQHVVQFLTHLEEDRGCSARTRNQRLAAIRAFARFIGSRDPAHVEWCGNICNGGCGAGRETERDRRRELLETPAALRCWPIASPSGGVGSRERVF